MAQACSRASARRSTGGGRRCLRNRDSSSSYCPRRLRYGTAPRAGGLGTAQCCWNGIPSCASASCHRCGRSAAAGHRQSVAAPEKLVNKATRSHFSVQALCFRAFVRARPHRTSTSSGSAAEAARCREHFGMEPGQLPVSDVPLFAGDHRPRKSWACCSGAAYRFDPRPMGWRPCTICSSGNWGGTAFYRHRSTGFEYVDLTRRDDVLPRLQQESRGGRCHRSWLHRRGHSAVRADRTGGRRIQPDRHIPAQLVAFRHHRQRPHPAR